MIEKRALKIAGTLGLAALLAIGGWILSMQGKPPFANRANPNAYGNFTRSVELLVVELGELEKQMDHLDWIVRTNGPAMEAVRSGLQKEFEAPLHYYQPEFDRASELARFKRVAQAMRLEGLLAQHQDRFADAADVYLDIIRFGRRVQWGPTIAFLVGSSIEAIGLSMVENIEGQLNGGERIAVAAKLQELGTERISLEELQKRESYFIWRNTPTPFHYMIVRRNKAARDFRAEIEDKYQRQTQTVEALLARLRRGAGEKGL